MDAIKSFQNGQVYSVLSKDSQGNFHPLNKQKEYTFAERVALASDETQSNESDTDPFLINVVTQEVLFNEEISTVTYIKDITFGVLYEQIKVQN